MAYGWLPRVVSGLGFRLIDSKGLGFRVYLDDVVGQIERMQFVGGGF